VGDLDRAALAEKLGEGARAWPSCRVDPAAFEAAVARGLANENTSIADLHTSDIFLVLACLDGQAEAIAAFERDVVATVRASVERAAEHPSDAEDALQSMREKLLVATSGSPPKLAQYTGLGALVAWVRVAAVREVLQGQRKTKRSSIVEDVDLVLDGSTGPRAFELGVLRDLHGDAFRKAVQEALRSLTAEQRTILRFHAKDGLTIDQLAPMLGVHRATAARRLERARSDALDATRAILCTTHGLSASEARSLCLALASEVDVSIGRALADEVSP